MNRFKFLKIINFEYLLKNYELLKTSIKKNLSPVESTLIGEVTSQNLTMLVESTFLQLYATLEEFLYYECEQQFIKKNASLLRFEAPLNEQGYVIHAKDWGVLLNLSKIRNCLLHGNGRLDADKYGVDTQQAINALNQDANSPLIELIHLTGYRAGTAKIKLNENFLYYCVIKIKSFIDSQATNE